MICSSIQFSSPDHGWEKWANFPHEKRRLLDMLDKYGIENAFFISGDMHYGELSAEKTPKGTPIWDLTSSGFNYFEAGEHYPNRNRVAIHDKSPNFGWVEIDWHADSTVVRLQVRTDAGVAAITKEVTFPVTKRG
jgi:alkaline phosphatase D